MLYNLYRRDPNKIKKALAELEGISLLEFFSSKPVEKLEEILKNLDDVEVLAIKMEEKRKKLIGDTAQLADPKRLDEVCNRLSELSDRIEALEVVE